MLIHRDFGRYVCHRYISSLFWDVGPTDCGILNVGMLAENSFQFSGSYLVSEENREFL